MDKALLIRDGRSIEVQYNSETWFRIEIGRGKEGYHSHLAVKGDLDLAVSLYDGTEVRKGSKKRLVKDGYGFQKLLVHVE
jgi:hypothetical protein